MEEPKTLEELSEVYGVSGERIRQLEVKAMDFLTGLAATLPEQRNAQAPARKPVPPMESIIERSFKSIFHRPETNPDPKLVDVPYIGRDGGAPWFHKALKVFNAGSRDGFERASIVRDGKEYPGEGRWVYVGPVLPFQPK